MSVPGAWHHMHLIKATWVCLQWAWSVCIGASWWNDHSRGAIRLVIRSQSPVWSQNVRRYYKKELKLRPSSQVINCCLSPVHVIHNILYLLSSLHQWFSISQTKNSKFTSGFFFLKGRFLFLSLMFVQPLFYDPFGTDELFYLLVWLGGCFRGVLTLIPLPTCWLWRYLLGVSWSLQTLDWLWNFKKLCRVNNDDYLKEFLCVLLTGCPAQTLCHKPFMRRVISCQCEECIWVYHRTGEQQLQWISDHMQP